MRILRSVVFMPLLSFLASPAIAVSITTPAHLWSLRAGGTGLDQPTSVAADPDGTIFVAGSFSGTADFGGGALVSAGDKDIFLVCYNSDGTHRWSRRFGGTGEDIATDVVVDQTTDVTIAHLFQRSQKGLQLLSTRARLVASVRRSRP
jgi:hypothetical protein